MSTRSNAVSQWHWVTPTHVAQPTTLRRLPWQHRVATTTNVAHRTKHHELWAGAGYLLVWSLLWLAVIVTVLAPLDSFVGAR
jgi:hypothetical protein